jgi:threonine synthase
MVADSRGHYICAASSKRFAADEPLSRCPHCLGHLNLDLGPGLRPEQIDTATRSLWRYRRALRPTAAPTVTLGEGWTPLVGGQWDGNPVLWKLEYISPSGSFKDRGIAVMLNYLLACGIRSVGEDSSGNGGAALATYSAAAGIACRIYVPEATSAGKIVQIAATGAEVIKVPGSRQAVADAAVRGLDTAEHFYASHNWQPHFLEGTKTLAYEIWEALGFQVPAAIVVPVGGASNLLGCHIGFSELIAAGQISRMPRLYGIQSEACAPLAAAFDPDARFSAPGRPTIAEGIAVSRPIRIREVVEAVRSSEGAIIAVSEAQIADAHRRLARQGLYVEPTSATAAAGLSMLYRRRLIESGERVVIVLTGGGLKATDTIRGIMEEADRAQPR